MATKNCTNLSDVVTFLTGKSSTQAAVAKEKVNATSFKNWVDGLRRQQNNPKFELVYDGDGGTFFLTKLTVTYKTDSGDQSFVYLEGVKARGNLTVKSPLPTVAAYTRGPKLR